MSSQQGKYDIKIKKGEEAQQKPDAKKHMDFDGAYKAYSHWVYRTPWYKFQFHSPKNRKIALFILLLATLALVLYVQYEEEKEEEKKQSPPTEILKNTKK